LASSWFASNEVALSTPIFSGLTSMRISPNPVLNLLTILSDNQIEKIQVFDVLGNLMFNTNQQEKNFKIDCSAFAKGIYILTFLDESGWHSKKIIKQ
jgi:hypothetical protein